MTEPLANCRIALGVTGSIAAYKALTVASRLTQAGALVDVLMTRSAQELVRPMAFQALTHRPVVTDLWQPTTPLAIDHVAIARAIDALVVAPATADVIARLALGRADDALTTTALATRAPLLVAPAMEPRMWSHEATQHNVATLRSRGVVFVGPELGRMASGEAGVGRMTEPPDLLEHLRLLLVARRGGPLRGRRVVITAGPTFEAIDPVRFVSNHSSGRMGLALARVARDRAAEVTLIVGPTALPTPAGVREVRVESALDMRAAVMAEAPGADALIMTAAVADYRPATRHPHKIKKSDGDQTLRMVRNPDILCDLDRALADAGRRPVRVAFAAETENLVTNAQAKLVAKGVDLVVANPVPEAFGSDTVSAVLVDRQAATALGPLRKDQLAESVLERVAELIGARDLASAAAVARP